MSGIRAVYLYNVNVVTPDGVIENGWIHFAEGLIEEIGSGSSFDDSKHRTGTTDEQAEVIDGRKGWVLPGFIDVHVHGGYGYDFMDADSAGLDAITRFHAQHGTATMLATTVTASKSDIDQVLDRVSQYRETDMPYAQLNGVHLEGPFISAKWPGAQNPQHITEPQLAWLEDWTQRFPELVRMQTLAPETEGALPYIEALTSKGIVAALGHTDATYEQVQLAVQHGLSHAVHSFNAMRGLHHREPGTVGAVMSNPAIMAEIIADGHHVHPVCISLLAKVKGPDNLVLITDAMSAAGLGNGDYQLGDLDVVVQDGVARLKEGDSLAGSTLTMIEAFRYAVQKAGLSVEHASRMASGNPARRLGIDQITGALHPGKQADILLLNEQLELERVWIQGRVIL
ncbi:N-acetylglucosamine-6-phosphate deacetylase [Paenibacillus sp. LMG 31456]|uniref:N-acetylglucosamine-6-phosphate deacetylase n=1 Tax=Paenibacillus foliorum TaxID=2654974 RepID=A0A972GWY1_9BACL|nr:N-acetylglucosamine-6-phosphate deacetylase [Paenibacillus foliorum]NOU98404.1 N-acetylglucosamine-6-phosphate deacetylase [Paenibacillus foliorum]